MEEFSRGRAKRSHKSEALICQSSRDRLTRGSGTWSPANVSSGSRLLGRRSGKDGFEASHTGPLFES